MKALANDKIAQNINHTLVFHFYLFSLILFYKMNQNTDNDDDLG